MVLLGPFQLEIHYDSMNLISPRRDLEHCASWFYDVKDKILLGHVAAKAHLSLTAYS